MAFTYTPSSTPSDRTLVRYHTGDTESATAMWQDDEIDMVLAVEGSVGAAVISLIKSAMTRLAREPDMQADWLKIDWRRSAESWMALLGQKKEEFGLGWSMTASALPTWRDDSHQTEAPDYTDPYAQSEE